MEQAQKETWATGSRAAAAGGVTCVVDQPNTAPPTTDAASLERKLDAANKSLIDYCLNGALSERSDIDALAPRVSAFGETFTADGPLKVGDLETQLHRATRHEKLCTIHAEDPDMVRDGIARNRGGPPETWTDARPAEAEVTGVRATVDAARHTGADIHLCHSSVPESVDIVTAAGYTAEATPHHLLLNRDALAEHGALARCNPPLRDEEHRRGMWKHLLDGNVVIATDHAPHCKGKNDAFWDAPSGIPGIQTSIPLLLAKHLAGDLPLDTLMDACSRRPAEIMGLPKGRIAPGYDADLALYDLATLDTVETDTLQTKAGYSLFEEWDAVFPVRTLVRGRTVYHDGKFGEPAGRFRPGSELKR